MPTLCQPFLEFDIAVEYVVPPAASVANAPSLRMCCHPPHLNVNNSITSGTLGLT
jgi:hypothetical protein